MRVDNEDVEQLTEDLVYYIEMLAANTMSTRMQCSWFLKKCETDEWKALHPAKKLADARNFFNFDIRLLLLEHKYILESVERIMDRMRNEG